MESEFASAARKGERQSKLDRLALARLKARGGSPTKLSKKENDQNKNNWVDQFSLKVLNQATKNSMKKQQEAEAPIDLEKRKEMIRQRTKHLGIGANKLTREELEKLKREAVIREREKRRAERQAKEESEKQALLQAQKEAIQREKARAFEKSKLPPSAISSTASKQTTKQPLAKEKVDLLSYKEEAKRREMKRERMRRKAERERSQPKRVSQLSAKDIASYKEQALAAEKRKLQKNLDKDKTGYTGLMSLQELERHFNLMAGEQAVLSIPQIKLLLRDSAFSLGPLDKQKFLSWISLQEYLIPSTSSTSSLGENTLEASNSTPNSVHPPSRRERTSREKSAKQGPSLKEVKRRIKLVMTFASTSFQELARHSPIQGKVYPSDLNAVLSEELSEDIHVLRGGLRLPCFESSNDEPISWTVYSRWLLESLLKDVQLSDKDSFRDDFLTTTTTSQEALNHQQQPKNDSQRQDTKNLLESTTSKVNSTSQHQQSHALAALTAAASLSSGEESESESEADSVDGKNKPPRSSVKEGVQVVTNKIKSLEAQLSHLENGDRPKGEETFSDEDGLSSVASQQETEKDKVEESEDEEDNKTLFSGRCWMLCERKNEKWLHPRYAEEEEWVRANEVCAQVEVTQVQDPFQMYLRVQLLRSGLTCVRRVGIDELTHLTAHCAKRLEQSRMSLSKSGNHVQLGSRAERYQCRNLGPEEWTREELRAAIDAEESMLEWVQQGRIPKQNDLVQWLLLHSIIRISGDELDPEVGYAHLVLPGDLGDYDLQSRQVETALGNLRDRLNRVQVIRETPPVNKIESSPPTKTKASAGDEENLKNKARENRAPSAKAQALLKSRAQVVSALNAKDPSTEKVNEWLEQSKRRLIEDLETVSKVSGSDLKKIFKQCSNASQVLFSLVDIDVLTSEWKRKAKSLSVADVFDIFRRHEEVHEPGSISVESFLAVLQDVMRLDVPSWQLALWHRRYPEYRAFIRAVYQLI